MEGGSKTPCLIGDGAGLLLHRAQETGSDALA